MAEILGGIEVHVDDVLAFQSSGPDLGLCHAADSSTSVWQQTTFISSGDSWMDATTQVALYIYSLFLAFSVCRYHFGEPDVKLDQQQLFSFLIKK